jgi:hypothetical protein
MIPGVSILYKTKISEYERYREYGRRLKKQRNDVSRLVLVYFRSIIEIREKADMNSQLTL